MVSIPLRIRPVMHKPRPFVFHQEPEQDAERIVLGGVDDGPAHPPCRYQAGAIQFLHGRVTLDAITPICSETAPVAAPSSPETVSSRRILSLVSCDGTGETRTASQRYSSV